MKRNLIKSKKLIKEKKQKIPSIKSKSKSGSGDYIENLPHGGWSTKNNKVFINGSEITGEMREKQAVMLVEKRLSKDGYSRAIEDNDIDIRASATDEHMTIRVEAGGDAEDIDESTLFYAMMDAAQMFNEDNAQYKELFGYKSMSPDSVDWYFYYGEDTTKADLRFTNSAYRYTKKELEDLEEEFPEMFEDVGQ